MNAQVLEKVEIFADLSPSQLTQIYAICREAVFLQGEQIFAEESPSTEFYVILEGEVAIQVNPNIIRDSRAVQFAPGTIAVLFPGQSFGEVALVDQGLRSASAVCQSMFCKCLVIERQDLMALLKKDPRMGFAIMNNLATDLCTKIRLSNLNLREALLYLPSKPL
ncbi:MAG: cyclic nucleotide-binding domain-containing protein [Chloroflexota bacterium]